MKDRMKRLLVLSLTVALGTGTIYGETRLTYAEDESAVKTRETAQIVEMETAEVEISEAETSEVEVSEAEIPEAEIPEAEIPEVETTETEISEAETTEAETEKEDKSKADTPKEETSAEAKTEATEEKPETTEEEKEEAEETEETEEIKETEETEEPETQEPETQEPEVEKTESIVLDESGTILQKEKIAVPEELTVGSETYPVDYGQGVYKVAVPEGTKTLQIQVPDQKTNEEIHFTKWSGYVTEVEDQWHLSMDKVLENAYTGENNCYFLNLEQFSLSQEELTLEQLAVYGELSAEKEYGEILLSGEMRSELLLVEYEKNPVLEEELPVEVEVVSETDPEEDADSETPELEEVPVEEAAFEEEAEETEELEEESGIALYSASTSDINSAYKAAGKNLASSAEKYTPTVASINGEWQILGLSRSGQKVDEEVYTKYLANVAKTLIENGGVLHKKKYTDYSRVVLALTSLGVDVTNVAGYNLLQPLSDFDQTVWQGVNGAGWALIAFDSHDYEIPTAEAGKTQNSREKLIENILSQEISGGGWDLSGRSADPDVTAMMLQALAPYYDSDPKVKKAVDRGVAKLSTIQKKNGSYATYGSETSESCSQVIVALTALGINPNTDTRFIKKGNSVVDALLTYANADGSFKHVLSGGADQMATEQAYYALTAYERFIGGKTRLYDMSDVVLESDKEKAAAAEKLIKAIPDKVKLSDKGKIQSAKAMYDSLNKTQKGLISAAQVSRLEKAVKSLQKLEAAQKGEEGNTGTKPENPQATPSITPSAVPTISVTPSVTPTVTPTEAPKKPGGSTQKVDLVSGGNKTGSTTVGSTSAGSSLTGKQEKPEEQSGEKEETKKEDTLTAKAEKTAEKKDKKVKSLISEINSLFKNTKTSKKLPEKGEDFSDSQKQKLLDIYRTYQSFTATQKKQVSECKNYPKYEESLNQFKEVNHFDETTGTDLRENEEETLPWYVQVEAGTLLADTACETAVKEALKEQGEMLSYMNISLMDLLNGTVWEPDALVRVSIPMVDLGTYEHVAVVHLKEDGSMEFLEGHISGENLEFDTDHFSRFGIVGYNGIMEELMTPQEENQIWIYLLPGAGAAALFVLLLIIRMVGSRKKKEEVKQ